MDQRGICEPVRQQQYGISAEYCHGRQTYAVDKVLDIVVQNVTVDLGPRLQRGIERDGVEVEYFHQITVALTGTPAAPSASITSRACARPQL
jgi:hypothetical protein